MLLVVWFIIEFLIKPAPVRDGLMPGVFVMQFVRVSVEEEKESWVAAETLQGNILRRNLSIWRTET